MLEYYRCDAFKLANDLAKNQLSDFGSALKKSEQNKLEEIHNSKDNVILVSESYALVYIRTLEGWKLIKENCLPKCKEFDKEFNFTSDQYKSKENENFLVVRGIYELINYRDCYGVIYWNDVKYKGRIRSIVRDVKIIKPTKRYIKEILDL